MNDAEKIAPPVYHIPVMLAEALEGLAIEPGGVYADCTFGGGGHSLAILQKLNENGRLVAFDQDEAARQNLPVDKRLTFIPENFRHIQRFLRLKGITGLNGILADLGVSSHQFDEAGRGFSIRFDAPLDMRMDVRQSKTAADLVNQSSEEQLHKIFEKYGEVTNAKTLARTIAARRTLAPIRTISELMDAVKAVVKGNPKKYFAQVFQALRIAVNDEMGALEELLRQVPELLKPGGRAVVITFHSLEDRLVKDFFRNGPATAGVSDEVFGNKPENPLKLITKKPLTPSPGELRQNPRSRSAKMRIAEMKGTTPIKE